MAAGRLAGATTGELRSHSRTFIIALVLALGLVLFPVEPVVADTLPPQVVSETVDHLPEQARADVETANDVTRSKVIEGPIDFTGLGIQGVGPEPEVRVRTLSLDGEWSPWTPVEILDVLEGPDPDSDEYAQAEAVRGAETWTTDAVWAGEASHAQLEVAGGRLDDVEMTFIDSMGLSESRLERIRRAFRSVDVAGVSEAEAASRPRIISRSAWGANEKWRRNSPSYATVRYGVLHHTATSNSYSRSEAAGQVRSIYYYHTQKLGWNDIGYNFLVDRFGRIYEGRYGGVDRGVVGAHSGGWNTGSFGVALMGHHGVAPASRAARGAATDIIAWKYNVHGINPSPSARVRANGYNIRTLEGHRNLRGGYTKESTSEAFRKDCPGQYLYERMGAMRRSVASKAAGSTSPFAMPSGWMPVTGDWNGDGNETAGWFRNGRWRLSNATNNKARVNYRFSFGRAGDLPVVGDWNADGTDTIGVFRNGRWYTRNENAKGPAAARFSYGRGGDIPVVGDFNGTGRDTVGVVRGRAWHLRFWAGSGPANLSFSFGRASDAPIVGNWNGVSIRGVAGDGIGVRRGKKWFLRDRPQGDGADHEFRYGRSTDVPVVSNWNGPHRPTAATGLQDGIGVVRSIDWHVRRDPGGGSAHASFRFGPS